MKPGTIFQRGAIRRVAEILRDLEPGGVFLVRGHASYCDSGAQAALEPVLARWRVRELRVTSPNPKLADVEAALRIYRSVREPLILAVGGGSVLDTAKLISLLSAQPAAPIEVVCGRAPVAKAGPPIIAVPTTAGTGSEATQFAVVYVGHTKHSVSHESMMPLYAIVDPELTRSVAPTQAAVSGLDALSQAIESLWSVHSDAKSSAHAKEALCLARDNLWRAVHSPSSDTRWAMAKAAHLSGLAINITRTTAPHALSYAMTSYFGVPHGHAVALALGEILAYNSGVTAEDVVDPRGAEHVRRVMAEIHRLLGGSDAASARHALVAMVHSLGLPTRLQDVGIRTASDRDLIAATVNAERLANNPRKLTAARLREVIDRIA